MDVELLEAKRIEKTKTEVQAKRYKLQDKVSAHSMHSNSSLSASKYLLAPFAACMPPRTSNPFLVITRSMLS